MSHPPTESLPPSLSPEPVTGPDLTDSPDADPVSLHLEPALTQERRLSSAQRREEAISNTRTGLLKSQRVESHNSRQESLVKRDKISVSSAQRRAQAFAAIETVKPPMNYLNPAHRYEFVWNRTQELTRMNKNRGMKKRVGWLVLGPALLTLAVADSSVLFFPNLGYGAYKGAAYLGKKTHR